MSLRLQCSMSKIERKHTQANNPWNYCDSCPCQYNQLWCSMIDTGSIICTNCCIIITNIFCLLRNDTIAGHRMASCNIVWKERRVFLLLYSPFPAPLQDYAPENATKQLPWQTKLFYPSAGSCNHGHKGSGKK